MSVNAGIFGKVWYGLSHHGLGYLLRVPKNELAYPRHAATKRLRALLVRLLDLLAPRPEPIRPDDNLVLVYDLAVSPVSFDMAAFLATAEIERRDRGFAGIEVAIIPEERQADIRAHFLTGGDFPAEQRQKRIERLILPMLRTLPSFRRVHVFPDRESALAALQPLRERLAPRDYRGQLARQPDRRLPFDRARAGKNIWPLLEAPEGQREAVRQQITALAGGRRVLVITLRNSAREAERNSRMAEWAAFVAGLDRDLYLPVLLPDVERPDLGFYPGLEREIMLPEIAADPASRLALYEAAWLNISLMHGPLELAFFSERTRYLVFLEPSSASSSRPNMLRDIGIEPLEDLPFAQPWQRVVWHADDRETIARSFAEFAPVIASLGDKTVR